jgi:4-carboxymuconolactone decarboxylase
LRAQAHYQAVPYVGMAKVFDFIHATNEVLTERGVALEQIIGSDVVARLYAAAPADQQHIQRFLSANCFGDHLSARRRPNPKETP